MIIGYPQMNGPCGANAAVVVFEFITVFVLNTVSKNPPPLILTEYDLIARTPVPPTPPASQKPSTNAWQIYVAADTGYRVATTCVG
jgi:hypothetical protein